MTRSFTARISLVLTSAVAALLLNACASESENPGTPVCSPKQEDCNGRDDDCNGKVDDDGKGGAITQSCEGSNKQAGKQTCASGKWGECKVSCVAKAEECDGQDNDCNGKVDDDGKGNQMTAACETSTKLPGTKTCSNGLWGQCESSCKPVLEDCDGQDNDCDGKVDTDPKGAALIKSCVASNKTDGTQTCANGKWGDCVSGCKPKPETCNGLDDDCDGMTDEDNAGKALTETCESKCGGGTRTCAQGVLTPCNAPQPKTETCNGVDDDCDGQVDEDFECAKASIRNCGPTTEQGECQFGSQVCNASCKWDACKGATLPAADKGFCDDKDHDCDGQKNTGCGCTNGKTQSCCGGTTVTCQGGAWPACPTPPKESCNQKDDDCNNKTDDNLDMSVYGPEEKASGADDCTTNYLKLADMVEGELPTKSSFHLYRANGAEDKDFFLFTAKEASDLTCFTNPDYYECYEAKVKLSKKPAGTSYRFCLYDLGFVGSPSTCAAPQKKVCTTSSVDSVSIKWEGDCGLTDNRLFAVEVYAEKGTATTCEPYELTFEVPDNSPQQAKCSL